MSRLGHAFFAENISLIVVNNKKKCSSNEMNVFVTQIIIVEIISDRFTNVCNGPVSHIAKYSNRLVTSSLHGEGWLPIKDGRWRNHDLISSWIAIATSTPSSILPYGWHENKLYREMTLLKSAPGCVQIFSCSIRLKVISRLQVSQNNFPN
jgi:hypothetical protein